MASISESEEGVVRICGEQSRGEVIILISTKWKMKVSGNRKVGISKLIWGDAIHKRHDGDWSTD